MINIDGKEVEIHVRGGFSERKGIKNFSEMVQINNLSVRSRNLIYTCICKYIQMIEEDVDSSELIEYIYIQLMSLTKDDIPYNYYTYRYDIDEIFKFIKKVILQLDYSDIFDFIDGLIIYFKNNICYINKEFTAEINQLFINENINYRILNNMVTDIIQEKEIESIEETLNNPYIEVSQHYSKAIEQLYKVKDFDNSIKESISSVEAMCQILTQNNKATLGDALKSLKNRIHPAMESAFQKLYGYTSDANGIRHANGLGEGDSTFEEAKYMLISCSAFVNYLKENFEKDK